jgi:hypothetical protein
MGAVLAVILAVAAGLVVAQTPAQAAEAPGCHLGDFGGPVWEWGDPNTKRIYTDGSRAQCVHNRAWVTLRLKKHVSLWADDTVAEKTKTNVVNTLIWLTWYCPPNGDGQYFTEMETNAGGKVTSERVRFTC